MRSLLFAIMILPVFSAAQENSKLTRELATRLARLPLKCADNPFPYKTGVVFSDNKLITEPKEYHPAFYGCFDWHSSVHGHWMMIRLLKMYPDLPQKDSIRAVLNAHLTKENINKEITIFDSKENKSFERTYGWAWLLQLQNELITWPGDADAQKWKEAVEPLAKKFSANTIDFLNRLVYPIRVGEHPNLAFGLCLSFDYAVVAKDSALVKSIVQAADRFYYNDKGCPMNWEPSGYDFLSPCLEEAALMSRVMPKKQYASWLIKFLPQLFVSSFHLEPGKVKDRTDGKLVHLDGLNLSRSWCLSEIITALGKSAPAQLRVAQQKHLAEGLKNVASGDYAGEHWLASFAVYALTRD